MEKKKSNLQQAFEETLNMAGLGGAVALSLALIHPLPFLVGLVAEAAYLLFVPDSRWYLERLGRREDAEIVARREALKAQVFPGLSQTMQQRFLRLEAVRKQIGEQDELQDQNWFRQVARRLDYLLERFLLFAQKEVEFRRYLLTVLGDEVPGYRFPGGLTIGRALELSAGESKPEEAEKRKKEKAKKKKEKAGATQPPLELPPDETWVPDAIGAIQQGYSAEAFRLTSRRDQETDPDTQAVLEKRIEVLEQRREYIGKIGQIMANLGHQMHLLQDSFGLINDQIRARTPEQVLAEVDGVVAQTDSMTRLLEEFATLGR